VVVEVRARDRAALLVEWLNELIFLSEANKQVFTRFEVERAEETVARGRAWGVSPEVLKTAVKAATWHQVKVEQQGGQWQAGVVLDV
jgi:SHS2 domain-containing protein